MSSHLLQKLQFEEEKEEIEVKQEVEVKEQGE